jgi:hypothetical protein
MSKGHRRERRPRLRSAHRFVLDVEATPEAIGRPNETVPRLDDATFAFGPRKAMTSHRE